MKNHKTRILFDISPLIYGNSGIQQDLKSILQMITTINEFEIDYLIYDMQENRNYLQYNFNSNKDNLIKSSQIFSLYSSLEKPNISKNFLLRKLKEFRHSKRLSKANISKFILDKRLNKSVYNLLFSDNSFNNYEKFNSSNIIFLDWSLQSAVYGYQRHSYDPPTLDFSEYDFVFFAQEIPLKVKGAKKIVRTYDIIKITYPHLVHRGDFLSNFQYRALQDCINQNTIFSSISNTTKANIEKMFQVKISITSIPVAIPDIFKHQSTKFDIREFSNSFKNRNKYFHGHISKENYDYILSLSTIEPRKNILTSYRAFKLMKSEFKLNIKFVIAGTIGWNLSEEYFNMMHDQDVIILEGVTTSLLPYLYSNAKALLFIPFEEGFGVPPIEAMACGCPVILSDIPVNREIHGGADPYFVNPYDTNDVKDKIIKVINGKNTNDLKNRIKRGLIHIKKYQQKYLKKLWIEFFTKL